MNYLSYEQHSNNEFVVISEMMTLGSLNEYLCRLKKLGLAVCQNWFKQILTGLSALHSKKIVHGKRNYYDIYINIKTGEVKIGDLIIVKLERIIENQIKNYQMIDDIKQFGLLALEIALMRSPSHEKNLQLIEKYYDKAKLNNIIDNKEIRKFTSYIKDPMYRSLVLYCLSANSAITTKDILNHPFFSKVYKCDEILQIVYKKNKYCSTEVNYTLDYKPFYIIKSTKTKSNSKKIDIILNVINDNFKISIEFQYNIEKDTPIKISEEMRTQLKLPETYISTFQDSLHQIRIFCNIKL